MPIKSLSFKNFRPKGFQFPAGLSTISVDVDTSANAATNATGGVQTVVGSNVIHTFTTSGSFVAQYDLTLDFLCIGGGGGGGGHGGGGGGAGGYRNSNPGELTGGGGAAETALSFTAGTTVTVTIGDGGTGGSNSNGTKGTPTSITGPGLNREIHSEGGGYGAGGGSPAGQGGPGGSGGGPGGGSPLPAKAAGVANTSVVQGFDSGASGTGGYRSGGGGGAGEAGNTDGEMFGGDGLSSEITGSAVTRGGGGGGQSQLSSNGPGGDGGGGAGTNSNGITAAGGGVNTGGGGGAQHHLAGSGGTGGPGFVVLKYPKEIGGTETFRFYAIDGANTGVLVP
jgi:hypothetical protein